MITAYPPIHSFFTRKVLVPNDRQEKTSPPFHPLECKLPYTRPLNPTKTTPILLAQRPTTHIQVQYEVTPLSTAPFSASTCGADVGAPPTNLSGDMWVGGVWAQDYKGSMAYLRFYDSAVANLALVPGNMAPGGELLRYEFETAGELERETSGNVPARPLSMAGGPPTAVATP